MYASEVSSYTSLKNRHNNRNILSIYYRTTGLRISIKDDEKIKMLYYKLLKEEKVYQNGIGRAEGTKGTFQFYVKENVAMAVIDEYVQYILQIK